MIVVDSSALVAILQGEPETEHFTRLIDEADLSRISAVSLLETAIVLRSRGGERLLEALFDFLDKAGCEVVPFDNDQALIAIAAYARYGKGVHAGAALNFGDCAAYALAKSLDAPLLYKGEDFAATDIASAV